MRAVLTLLLINGLVPAFGEVVEAAVHYTVEGYLASGEAGPGDPCDEGDENGCGTTEHHCLCCASQPLVASPVRNLLPSGPAPMSPATVVERWASLDAPAPPLRPPIAS
jgi:hypothetical protein